MCPQISTCGEFGLIDILKKNIRYSKKTIKGIGDDTAVLPLNKSHYQLFTTDMLVEGRHFIVSETQRVSHTLQNSAERSEAYFAKVGLYKDIGHKALACSVSDIAAMGGVPTCAVVSLGVPKTIDARFVKGIYAGLNKCAKKFDVDVVGGDTVASQKIILNVALLGTVVKNNLVLRSGAKIGDQIFVTGPCGRSLKSGKHLTFVPRVKESQFLVKKFNPSAMIDVSDGLAADLGHILQQSSVGAELYEEMIPKTKTATLNQALYDGEDFELVFTVSKEKASKLRNPKNKGLKFFYIGEITDKANKLFLVDKKGKKQKLKIKGYEHL